MISVVARVRGDRSWTARYEALRDHMLRKPTSSGRDGLVVLLRQGLAAWMRRTSATSSPRSLATHSHAALAAPSLSDDLCASFVQIMATMALAGPCQESHA